MLQIERVKSRILSAFPDLELEILPRESRGDLLQDIPLQTVEGTDFFTADLYRGLSAGEADIAIQVLGIFIPFVGKIYARVPAFGQAFSFETVVIKFITAIVEHNIHTTVITHAGFHIAQAAEVCTFLPG